MDNYFVIVRAPEGLQCRGQFNDQDSATEFAYYIDHSFVMVAPGDEPIVSVLARASEFDAPSPPPELPATGDEQDEESNES